MLPEVRVIVERAAARRASLEGLIEAIPADYWARRATGEAWSAHDHLAHVAGIDALTSETLTQILGGERAAWIAGATTPEMLATRREALLDEAAGMAVAALRERMRETRAELVELLAGLDTGHLEVTVLVAGVVDAWGEPLAVGLRRYLASLPEHDTEHEHAIRQAISAPPDLSAVALTRRLSGGRSV